MLPLRGVEVDEDDREDEDDRWLLFMEDRGSGGSMLICANWSDTPLTPPPPEVPVEKDVVRTDG